jgi:Fic family protein
LADVLRASARIHYLVASVHPFEDGNGRVARAAGDYAMLVHGFYYDVIMTDYRDIYLDALEASTWADTSPLFHFLEFSYLETLKRISGFFNLVHRQRPSF